MAKRTKSVSLEAESATYSDPSFGPCGICGFPRGEQGQIPIVEYLNGDNEEPQHPYINGYRPCGDASHSGS